MVESYDIRPACDGRNSAVLKGWVKSVVIAGGWTVSRRIVIVIICFGVSFIVIWRGCVGCWCESHEKVEVGAFGDSIQAIGNVILSAFSNGGGG